MADSLGNTTTKAEQTFHHEGREEHEVKEK